jgi:hypothetical protein
MPAVTAEDPLALLGEEVLLATISFASLVSLSFRALTSASEAAVFFSAVCKRIKVLLGFFSSDAVSHKLLRFSLQSRSDCLLGSPMP